MTKKHFEAIAQILSKHGSVAAVTRELSKYFQSVNKNFDADKFLLAAKYFS